MGIIVLGLNSFSEFLLNSKSPDNLSQSGVTGSEKQETCIYFNGRGLFEEKIHCLNARWYA